MSIISPLPNCDKCPRLVEYRLQNQKKFPDKHNKPVLSFGPDDAELLIVGLAPGLKGANFSGRPFTGDYAGDLLYETLINFKFANGSYLATPEDGLSLHNCRITNAVKCVPPQNKPTTEEIKQCQHFLISELHSLPNIKVILALGKIAHDAVLRSFNLKLSQHGFAHNAIHKLSDAYTLIDSYHCSRYNTQTGRLTKAMFEDVFKSIKAAL